MRRRPDETLARLLAALADGARRHARSVLVAYALTTCTLALYVATHLGVNTDARSLLAPDLPLQRAAAEFSRYFPSLDNTLLLVVDADDPAEARRTARVLAARLQARPAAFHEAYVPGGDPFFQRAGLLYRSVEELEDFADHLARLQPIIAALTRDASLATLAELIGAALADARIRDADPAEWTRVFDQVRQATIDVFTEYPLAVSWEELMLEGTALDEASRQVVVAEPVLQFDRLLAAGQAIDEIRAIVADVAPPGVRVRITGNPALNYEEMRALAWDMGWSGAASFVLVVLLVFLALRSFRLVAASAITLLTGLVWTAALAALTVGALNIVSISFGVLFIGLGIDFAIHLGMHFEDAARRGDRTGAALVAATRDCGASLVLCAASTALGFYAFLPADYRGVAELGLIAGNGMLVILVLTLTLFPPLTAVLLGDDTRARLHAPSRLRLGLPVALARRPAAVTLAAGTLAMVAMSLLPRLRFDSNVIAMRDPRTESVQAFEDLLATSRTSPWYADVLASDLQAADDLAARLDALDPVARALTLTRWVPDAQDEKRAILADVALLFDTPVFDAPPRTLPQEAQIAALRRLRDTLAGSELRGDGSPLARSMRRLEAELGGFLHRVADASDAEPVLRELERLLLGSFPAQMARLRRALDPGPVTLDDLPRELVHRMQAPDGHARVQVFPKENLRQTPELTRFVDAVLAVAPNATGVSVNILEFGRATVRSLREALTLALVAIVLLLLLVWRRVPETLLVLAPLLLSGLLLTTVMVALDVPFNFANIVVLPLLLGMGIDSGIHLVARARTTGADPARLLDSPSARAILFSAATTIASFGSLAFSRHRGIASLGVLLVCGMALMLVSNLVVLPALLALRAGRAARNPGTPR